MKTDTANAKFKNYIYSGIGIASHSKEVVRNLMEGLVRQGRLNEADGKKIVENAIKNMEKHMPDIENKYHQAIHKIITLANSEIMMLQKNMVKLEQKAGPAVRAVAKKAISKKLTATRKVAKKVVHKASK